MCYGEKMFAYDERGNMTREAYGNGWGDLVLTPDGYAAIERTFDERNLLTAVRYLGTDNQL